MKNLGIKLLSTYNAEDWGTYRQAFIPYGISILSAFLKKNNVEVTITDLTALISRQRMNLKRLRNQAKIRSYIYGKLYDKDIERFCDQIMRIASCEGYGIIGISVMSYLQFLIALCLAKKIKNEIGAKIVLGGAFITIHGREFFPKLPFVDYMISGDGQVPLLKLMEHLSGKGKIEDIPGLLYRFDSEIKMNDRIFFPIEDLSMPDFSGLNLNDYRAGVFGAAAMLPYQLSRGCQYKCSFCQHRSVYPSLEFKSHKKAITEIKAMKEKWSGDFFHFCDSAINLSCEYLDKLCAGFLAENVNISWFASARPDNLDEKILRHMKKAGCTHLIFGVESGSDKVLQNMGKKFTAEEASATLRNSHKAGIKNLINLIVGYPYETEGDIMRTAAFIKRNAEYIYSVAEVIPLRIGYDSELWRNYNDYGIKELRPAEDVFEKTDFWCFAYDEAAGLSWQEKGKQAKKHRKMVYKAVFEYIMRRKTIFKFMSFEMYFWLREKWRILREKWF